MNQHIIYIYLSQYNLYGSDRQPSQHVINIDYKMNNYILSNFNALPIISDSVFIFIHSKDTPS